MNAQQREAIVQALWPQAAARRRGVWGVLDCARDPWIYPALVESRLEFLCLYSGRLAPALERVAPQLVELHPGNRFTARWLDEGWGRSWGILVRIEDPSNLRHHLRKFLKVRDEQGRSLLFRYYDPRVLRAYLPTCTADELRALFGPIDSFLAETAAGDGLVEFGLRRGELEVAVRVDDALSQQAQAG
ncbi:MAG: DUF4123 domain-containing protein [Burkholderiales bacterium]|nr:DUF4123 domain-containing protein [Burkholderiales bacterium]MDE2455656.1 DUF4123 domain-containing protein [Burkholderiales bacterium]